MKTKHIIIGLVVILVLAVTVAVVVATIQKRPVVNLGSIETGQEYNATTTSHTTIIETKVIKTGWGSLGSVVVTGAGTSALALYDATSTDSLSGDSRISSTTQLIMNIPASLAAGTYVIDTTFTKGLLISYDVIGTYPSTTITFR